MNINQIKNHWYAYIYDQQENQTYDVELMLEIFGKEPKKILEVCCGGGRILVPLAKAGHEACGIDMDEDMMSMIPAKTAGMKNIRYRKADALTDDWGKDYDIIVQAGNIMINIETAGDYKQAQQTFIRKAAEALKHCGYLYLDFDLSAYPERVFNSTGERVHFEGYDDTGVYGKYIGCGGTFDSITQMTDGKSRTELTLPNGETHIFEKKSAKHIPTLSQVHEWLDNLGFVIEQEYGDYERNSIGETTHRAIIYAKKS